MLIALPLLIALIGFLMFIKCKDADMKEVGHIFLFCGILAFLLVGAAPLITLVGGK
jgi:hypothetical protein